MNVGDLIYTLAQFDPASPVYVMLEGMEQNEAGQEIVYSVNLGGVAYDPDDVQVVLVPDNLMHQVDCAPSD